MAAQDLREIKDNFLLEAGLVDARTSLQEMKISEYWDDKKIELNVKNTRIEILETDIENKNNRTIHQVVDDYNRVSRSTKLAFSGTMSTSVYVDNAKFIEGFPIVPRNMVLLEYEHPTIHGKPFLYLSRNGWNARGEWVSEIEYASAFLSGYYIVHEYNKELRSIYEDAMIMEHMYGKPIKVKWAVLERQPIILKVEEHEA